MHPDIRLTDTPAHFAPLFTAATTRGIQHIDAYITDKEPQTGKAIHLGIRSWQHNELIVAAINELPAAYSSNIQCMGMVLYAHRDNWRRLQKALFTYPSFQTLFDKCRSLLEKAKPDREGRRRIESEPGLFILAERRAGDRVCNPFLRPPAIVGLPQQLDRMTLAQLLLTGDYEDLRMHRCLASDLRPQPFQLARALIEKVPTIIGQQNGRIIFSNAAFPAAQFSFVPCSATPPLMAPPRPGRRARCVLWLRAVFPNIPFHTPPNFTSCALSLLVTSIIGPGWSTASCAATAEPTTRSFFSAISSMISMTARP